MSKEAFLGGTGPLRLKAEGFLFVIARKRYYSVGKHLCILDKVVNGNELVRHVRPARLARALYAECNGVLHMPCV